MNTRSWTELLVHLVWATKNRAPLIPVDLDAPLITFLREKAAEHDCEVIAAGCYFDHVHVLLRFVARVDLASVVQSLKGTTSRAFNAIPGTDSVLYWQNGYWAESFGPAAAMLAVSFMPREAIAPREPRPVSPREPSVLELAAQLPCLPWHSCRGKPAEIHTPLAPS